MQALSNNEIIEDVLYKAINELLLNSLNSKTFFYDTMETIFEMGIVELPCKYLFYLEYIYENMIKDSKYPFLFKEKYKNLIYHNVVSHLYKEDKLIENSISLTSSFFENRI